MSHQCPHLDPERGFCQAAADHPIGKHVYPGEVTVILDDPGVGYRIDRLFAYVSTGADGEGVIAAQAVGPLVGADAARMLALRPYAERIAKMIGRPVRLVRFDARTVIETLDPDTEHGQ